MSDVLPAHESTKALPRAASEPEVAPAPRSSHLTAHPSKISWWFVFGKWVSASVPEEDEFVLA
jgi:hypothetical protein